MTGKIPLPGSAFLNQHAADFLLGFLSANKVSRALVITGAGPSSAELISGCGIPAVSILPVSADSESACRAKRTKHQEPVVLGFHDGRPGRALPLMKTDGIRFDLILFEASALKYPEYYGLTRDLLEKKGHFLFTGILGPSDEATGSAQRPVVIKDASINSDYSAFRDRLPGPDFFNAGIQKNNVSGNSPP